MTVRIRTTWATALTALALAATGLGAAPAAEAAPACGYVAKALPLPAGATEGQVTQGDGGTRYVGSVDSQGTPVLWTPGKVTVIVPPSGGRGQAVDVSSSGVVVGNSQNPGSLAYEPFLWRNGRSVALTGYPEGAIVQLTAINDAGVVVGHAYIDGAEHGVAWRASAPAKMIDLGTSGDGGLYVEDVTNAGVAYGYTSDSGGELRAARGRTPGTVQYMPGVSFPPSSRVYAADGVYAVGAGQVIGQEDPDWPMTGVVWKGNQARALPVGTFARGVNSKGLMAADTPTGPAALAFGGTSKSLPPLRAADTAAVGFDVMEDGTVIGNSYGAGFSSTPVAWTCR